MKNHINIASKVQQLVFTKHFSTIVFKLQLLNLYPRRTLKALNQKNDSKGHDR